MEPLYLSGIRRAEGRMKLSKEKIIIWNEWKALYIAEAQFYLYLITKNPSFEMKKNLSKWYIIQSLRKIQKLFKKPITVVCPKLQNTLYMKLRYINNKIENIANSDRPGRLLIPGPEITIGVIKFILDWGELMSNPIKK
jgi:hypothetical protein